MKKNYIFQLAIALLIACGAQTTIKAQSFIQEFDDLTQIAGWDTINHSNPLGATNWFQGNTSATVFPYSGTGFIAANYQNTAGSAATGNTISDWLIAPTTLLHNGDVFRFNTTTTPTGAYPDRLQVRLSQNGASSNVGTTQVSVGDFTTLLVDINPTYVVGTVGGYPVAWTRYNLTLSGLPAAGVSGRIAFRYYVDNGGALGANSDYIGIDSVAYMSSIVDAAVSNVYTLGTIATPFINPHVVKALISNTGTTTITNKVVTLNVTGANSFTTTQTIASLAGGASTIVTFGGYNSTVTGTNTVTVSVPSDGNNTNNSVAVSQTVNTTSYNYAYGTVAAGSAGFNSNTGDVAVKFSTSSATTITAVNVNLNSTGMPYILRIWSGAGATPGALLYSSASQSSVVGITPITVSPAVAVNGGFFVGISQTDTVNVGINYQAESPIRTGVFYYSVPTGANTWADFATVPTNFRIMMEPVFGSCSVAPAQPGAITGTTTVCQSSSNTYSVTAVSGATSYNWTLPSGWSGSSSSNSITATAGATSGTITVSATNACGTSAVQTISVTVNATPAQPGTISGNSTICPNSSNTYSVAAVAGATYYTWTIPGGWSGASTSNSIFVTANGTGGNITVVAGNACGTSTSSVLTITVSSAPPQPGAITGPTTFCNGSTNTYSIVAIGGATSYTWTLPSGWSGSSTTNSITTTASANSGTISVTYTNACGTSPAQTLAVTAGTAPNQPGAISGVTTFCPGQTQVYSIGSVAGATSYTWTLPSGWSGSSTGTSITGTTGVNGGMVSVTATNSCGTSTAQTLAVSLGTAPAQPGAITGNASICAGGAQTYSISPVAGATSYVWNLPAGWAGGSNSTSITTITNATGGVVSVAAVNDCGTSTLQTLTVTVNAVPAQPTTINGAAAVCSGISGIYSITPVAGATSYTWTLPGGWSGSSTSSSITATATGVSGNITVTVTNACGTSPSQSLNVTVSSAAPAQPGVISGNTTVCSSSTTTYTVALVAGATSYNWTLPGGWSGTSTTNSIVVTVGSTGGSILVTAANGCGTSSGQTLAVTVNQSPAQPTVINGSATVCAGVLQTYSVATVAGATSYTWTPPAGWVGSSITNTINYTPSINSGNISVTANNSTCSSPAQILAVTVNTPPTMPGTIAGSATVCSGASEIYSVAPVNGATSYTWTTPSGWTGTSTTNTITSTVGTTGGNVTVTATNSCGTSSAQTFAVTVNIVPAQPGAITGSTTVCSSTNEIYNITAVAGATSYTWTLPGGWSGISTTNSITATTGASGGTISVTANNGACFSSPQTLAVTMNTVPGGAGAVSGPASVCIGSINTYTTSVVANATGYAWTVPAGANITGGQGTTTVTVSFPTLGNYNVQVAATNACGSGTPQGQVVTVNALPAIPTISVVGNTLQSSATTGNQWSLNGVAISGATNQFYTLDTAGTYSVTFTDGNGCSSTSAFYTSHLGISENQMDNVFTLYPNPSHDVINLSLTTSRVVDAAYVTNVLGKIVKVINAKNIKGTDAYSIDVKDLNQGMYFLSVQVDGRMITKKIIVE